MQQQGKPMNARTPRVLRVRKNLYSALEALRKQNHFSWLWVDAICINQNDSAEKQKQLAYMHTIYEKVSSVMIWLGPRSPLGERACEFVREIALADDPRQLAKDERRIDDWSSLVRLIRLRWFSRKWVVQELALAKKANVRCGASQVPWTDLRDAIALMCRYIDDIRRLFRASPAYDYDYYAPDDVDELEAKTLADTAQNLFRKKAAGVPFEPIQGLEYLVTSLQNFRNADPRDTINAFRNISKEARGSMALTGPQAPPEPDYNVNKTLVEIYIDFVRWIYDSTGRIDIICRKWALPELTERPKPLKAEPIYPALSILPSWIQTVGPEKETLENLDENARAIRSSEGVSFVGVPGDRPYNACYSMKGTVDFGLNHRLSRPPSEVITNGPLPVGQLPGVPTIGSLNSIDNSSGAIQVSQASASNDAHVHTDELSLASDDDQELNFHWDNVAMVDDSEPYVDDPSAEDSTAEPDPTISLLRQAHNGFDVSIRINGIQIGVINSSYSKTTEGVVHPDIIARLAPKWGPSVTNPAGRELPDKLWRGLVAERGADGRNPPPLYYRACSRVISMGSLTNPRINIRDLLPRETGLADVEKEYLRRVQDVTRNRRFFEAAREPEHTPGDPLLGFGPQGLAVRDIVCILFGCSVPVILRHGTATGFGQGHYYEFIGECYVYGLMDGEAIASLSEADLKSSTRQFKIF